MDLGDLLRSDIFVVDSPLCIFLFERCELVLQLFTELQLLPLKCGHHIIEASHLSLNDSIHICHMLQSRLLKIDEPLLRICHFELNDILSLV